VVEEGQWPVGVCWIIGRTSETSRVGRTVADVALSPSEGFCVPVARYGSADKSGVGGE
jgi:hypothetical protein